MELSTKKSGRQVKQEGRVAEKDVEKLADFKVGSLDFSLIEMAKNLDQNQQPLLFSDRMKALYEKVSLDMRLCRNFLERRDSEGIDKIAQQITQNALMMGAQKIIKTSVEMQASARIEDFKEIELIVGEMEQELLLIKDEILHCP